jgi:hypothetical protein
MRAGLGALLLLVAATPAVAQTVTAVSVASVKLTAGTRSSLVTLQGTDLEQIQSASVLKGGSVAAGVTAELAAASGKASTSRGVTIVAAATAAAGTDYKLQLTGGKAPIVASLAIEIVAPAATASALPLTPDPKLAAASAPAAQLPAPKPTLTLEPKPLAIVTPPTESKPEAKAAPAATLTLEPKPLAIVTPPTESKPEAKLAPAATLTLEPKPLALATPSAESNPPATDEKGAQGATLSVVTPQMKSAPTLTVPSASSLTTARIPGPTAILIVPPSVSSVVPSSVQLQPDARLTLALYGQSLDRLTAVSVSPAGKGTAGVTAALGTASPTMRTVTVTSGSTATAGRYQLTAQAGATSFIVNAAVTVIPRPAAPPVLTGVRPTPDGYTLVGSGFGSDATRVAVYEGFSRVSTFATTVTPTSITVRSRPTGSIQHRVEVGGVSSAPLTFAFPGPTIGSVGVTAAEMAKILASPKAALSTSFATAEVARPGGGGGAGAPAPGAVSSRAPGPPRGQAVPPKSATTGELTMTGLGPPPLFGQ